MLSLNKFYRFAIGAALTAVLLLLIPFISMLFTDEMDWNLFDFAAAWLLLFGAAISYKLIAVKMGNIASRIAAGTLVATALFLVWANLAVGLIGSEDNPANLMYIGVLAVGFTGAFTADFRPKGMARTLFGMALAHVLIAVIALIAGMHLLPGSSVLEILGVNVFFAVLWIGSALLFLYAARRQPIST